MILAINVYHACQSLNAIQIIFGRCSNIMITRPIGIQKRVSCSVSNIYTWMIENIAIISMEKACKYPDSDLILFEHFMLLYV